MEPALAIFASLLGNCYSATLSPGVEDTHCFREVYDGAHVRDTHVVTQSDVVTYQGETIYSEGPGGIEFRYINSLGGAGNGTARVEGAILRYEMTMRAAPDKPGRPVSGCWQIRDDGYIAVGQGEQAIRYTPAR